jgi:hypothetical protein
VPRGFGRRRTHRAVLSIRSNPSEPLPERATRRLRTSLLGASPPKQPILAPLDAREKVGSASVAALRGGARCFDGDKDTHGALRAAGGSWWRHGRALGGGDGPSGAGDAGRQAAGAACNRRHVRFCDRAGARARAGAGCLRADRGARGARDRVRVAGGGRARSRAAPVRLRRHELRRTSVCVTLSQEKNDVSLSLLALRRATQV